MTIFEDQLREMLDEGSAQLQLPVGTAQRAWVNGRRQRRRTAIIGCGLAIVAVIGVVIGIVETNHHDQRLTIGSPTSQHPPLATPTPTPANGPVNVNGFTFNPEPASAAKAPLSAEQAFGDYDSGHAIPAGMIAQYGTLTGGPHHDQAVWAYTSDGACWLGFGTKPVPTPASGYCTTWTFLSPTTGAEILSTQQN